MVLGEFGNIILFEKEYELIFEVDPLKGGSPPCKKFMDVLMLTC